MKRVIAIVAFMLIVAACGGAGRAVVDTAPADDGRTIYVEMLEFAFDLPELEVDHGETVTFVVTNVGAVDHEFEIVAVSDEHAHEEDHDGMDMDNKLVLAPGETGELTFTFDGEYEFIACQLPGHVEAGMQLPVHMGH